MLVGFFNMFKVLDFFVELLKDNEIRDFLQNLQQLFILEAFFQGFHHRINFDELFIELCHIFAYILRGRSNI